MSSDSELDLSRRLNEQLAVDRVRQGDALALEMIFTAYRAELLALAVQIVGVRALGEEVVQEVFLRIWTKREQWRIATSLRGYLRRAVFNVATRVGSSNTQGSIKGVELTQAEHTTPNHFADAQPLPGENLEYDELAKAIEETVSALPPRAKEVFALRRKEGLSNREIALKLGVAVKTVEIHMARALAAIRRKIAEWR